MKSKSMLLSFGLVCLAVLCVGVWQMQRMNESKQRGADFHHGGHSLFKSDAGHFALALSEYYKAFHAFPASGNQEIVRALLGQNPTKLALIRDSNRLEDEMLVDCWHNPYEMSIAEGPRLRLRSAGPNRKMGDSDDIIEVREIKLSDPARP